MVPLGGEDAVSLETSVTVEFSDAMADGTERYARLIVTVSVMSMGKPIRLGRYLNLLLAAALVVSGWLLDGATLGEPHERPDRRARRHRPQLAPGADYGALQDLGPVRSLRGKRIRRLARRTTRPSPGCARHFTSKPAIATGITLVRHCAVGVRREGTVLPTTGMKTALASPVAGSPVRFECKGRRPDGRTSTLERCSDA